MLVLLTETYCNKINIQITQRDFIQIKKTKLLQNKVAVCGQLSCDMYNVSRR